MTLTHHASQTIGLIFNVFVTFLLDFLHHLQVVGRTTMQDIILYYIIAIIVIVMHASVLKGKQMFSLLNHDSDESNKQSLP